METSVIVGLIHKAFYLTFLLCLPAVGTAAIVGLVMAVLQAATQIQDQAISQGLKFGAVMLVLILMSGWIGGELYRMGEQLMREFPSMVRGG